MWSNLYGSITNVWQNKRKTALEVFLTLFWWGLKRIRTAVDGFADRWLSHSPIRPSFDFKYKWWDSLNPTLSYPLYSQSVCKGRNIFPISKIFANKMCKMCCGVLELEDIISAYAYARRGYRAFRGIWRRCGGRCGSPFGWGYPLGFRL